MTNTTPNMDLILPDVTITTGPSYAYLLNAAQYLIDAHDHSTGKGVKVTPDGLNISSDLSFGQNDATDLRSARLFNNVTFTPGIADKTCLYALADELYYIDGAGNNVQITLNGALDLSGSISALTIKDNNLIIENNADTSKKFSFSAAALTTATSYTFTVPGDNTSATLVTIAAAQTLANKTLTAPVITSIVSGAGTITLPAITGTAVVSSQLDTASTATINAMASSESVSVLTGSTNTTLNGITAGYAGQKLTLINNSTGTLTINHNSGSAASGARISVPTGATVSYPANPNIVSSITFVYVTFAGTGFWFMTDANCATFITGDRTGTAPNIGIIGEQLISSVTSFTNGTTGQQNITSISLTPGVWDVHGIGFLNQNGATITGQGNLGISASSATISGLRGVDFMDMLIPGATVGTVSTGNTPVKRLNLSTTTTYYLVISTTVSAGTIQIAGSIKAVRAG